MTTRGGNKDVVVTINGRKYTFEVWTTISYRDIADIARYHSPAKPTVVMSREGQEARSLLPGESVMVTSGMIFNVADTSRA